MVRQDAIATGQSGDKYATKPTDGELTAQIAMHNDMIGHDALTFIHLTPTRTRVIFQAPFDQKLHDQALQVAAHDQDVLEFRKMLPLAGSTEP
jgi:hypothetical protein